MGRRCVTDVAYDGSLFWLGRKCGQNAAAEIRYDYDSQPTYFRWFKARSSFLTIRGESGLLGRILEKGVSGGEGGS